MTVMLERIGRLAVRRPKAVLITASAVLAAMVVLGIGAFGVLKSGGFDDTGSPSWKARQAITQEFGGEDNLVLVVQARTGFLQFFGLGCGLAILIDALLIRGVLVPSAMRVLGTRAWWVPGPLQRLHARVGVSESEGVEAPETPALVGVGHGK